MKNLFLYYLKKRIPSLAIVAFLTLVIGIVVTVTTRVSFMSDYNQNKTYCMESVVSASIVFLTVMMCIFATIIPIYEFSFKMRKNSVDLFYSLPVKRYKLYLVKYLIGIIELFVIFSVSFIYILIFNLIVSNSLGVSIDAVYFIPYYFSSLGLTILLFSWFSFVYTRGNTIFDGILYMVLSVFMVSIIVGAGNNIVNKFSSNNYYINIYSYTPYSLFVVTVRNFSNYIKYPGFSTPIVNLSQLLVTIILSIAFLVLFFILNNLKKAEDTSDVSKEWYTYRLLIPLYIIGLCVITSSISLGMNAFFLVIIGISGYVGYVIFNRSFKIKINDLIALGSAFTAGVILSILMNR